MTERTVKAEWGLKLVILGDPAVGKTSLIDKYLTRSFKEDYQPTLGVNIIIKDISLEQVDGVVRLILWDIAGQDKYELSRNMFFQGAAGAFLVYDITRKDTFNNISNKWLKEFKQYALKDAPFILIGNKIDMVDSILVNTDEGLKLSDQIDAIDFIKTSAKTGEKVEIAFLTLVNRILKNYGVEL